MVPNLDIIDLNNIRNIYTLIPEVNGRILEFWNSAWKLFYQTLEYNLSVTYYISSTILNVKNCLLKNTSLALQQFGANHF